MPEGRSGIEASPATPPPMAPEPAGGSVPEPFERAAIPQAAPSLAKTDAPQSTSEPRQPGTLLIYEADYAIAVYQVQEALEGVEALAKRVGGHLVERTAQRIVIRVPRDHFDEALSGVDKVGDVVRRDVRSQDVTDQYRDLDVRLRNARAVRDRLEELLAKAQTVEDSLKVEQQLARVTVEIEQLTATLKGLTDRIAYSKITVTFQPRATENVPDEVLRLPFPWLQSLGLSPLLNLHE